MGILSYIGYAETSSNARSTFTLRAQISLSVIYLLYWSSLFNSFSSVFPFVREVFVLFNLMWIGGVSVHFHYRPRKSRRYQARFGGKMAALGDIMLHGAVCCGIYILFGTLFSIIGWALMGAFRWLMIPIFGLFVALSAGFKIHTYLLGIKPILKIYLAVRKVTRRARKGTWGKIIERFKAFRHEVGLLIIHTLDDICQNPHTSAALSNTTAYFTRLFLNGMMSGVTAPSKDSHPDTFFPDETEFETFDDDDEPVVPPVVRPVSAVPELAVQDMALLSREERRQRRKERLANAPPIVFSTQPASTEGEHDQGVAEVLNMVMNIGGNTDMFNMLANKIK